MAVRDELHKDYYWSGNGYLPKCCLACRYYQLPESACILRSDWVTVHFPERHKCNWWVRA